jgi:hypothetical protein
MSKLKLKDQIVLSQVVFPGPPGSPRSRVAGEHQIQQPTSDDLGRSRFYSSAVANESIPAADKSTPAAMPCLDEACSLHSVTVGGEPLHQVVDGSTCWRPASSPALAGGCCDPYSRPTCSPCKCTQRAPAEGLR